MRNLAEIILKGCLEPPEGDNKYGGRCKNSAHALYEINPTLFTSTLTSVLEKREASGITDESLVRFVGTLGSLNASWRSLPNSARLRMLALVSNQSIETTFFMRERFFASGLPTDAEVRIRYLDVIDRLTAEQVDAQMKRPYPRQQWVYTSIRFLEESRNFRSAESNMRRVLRVSDVLHRRDITALGKAIIGNSQVRLASEMPTLLLTLFLDTRAIDGAREEWVTISEQLTQMNRDDENGDPYYSYSDLNDALENSQRS